MTKKDRSLIARVAGNVASGFSAKAFDSGKHQPVMVAKQSVIIAMLILAEVDERLVGGDGSAAQSALMPGDLDVG